MEGRHSSGISPIRSLRWLGHPTRLLGQVKRVVGRWVLFVRRRRHGQAQLLLLPTGWKEPCFCIRDAIFGRVGAPLIVVSSVHDRPPPDARPADPGVRRDRVRRPRCPRPRLCCCKVARWQNLIPSFPWIAPGWRGVGAKSKERKGSNFAAQRTGTGAIVQKPEGPNTYDPKFWL